MSEEIIDRCKCTLRESMLGDGCRVCQPRTYIAHLEDALKLAEGEIAQLEAGLAEAKLSDRDKEDLEIGKQIRRAAACLPDYFDIKVHVENGFAGVTLIDTVGKIRDFDFDENLSSAISEAIDAAIKDGRKIAQEDCEEKPCSFCFSRDCNGTCISGLDN